MASDDNSTLNRRERAALSPAERQSIIKNLFVEHDRFKDAITAVGSFHMPVAGGAPDFGVLSTLCGDTRTGKTFALERYAKRFPLSNGTRGDGTHGVVRRVVYADMPIDCNLRAMAEQIADALNISYSQRMPTRGLVGAILKELKRQQVEFLILDEFQEAFDINRKKTLKDARGLIGMRRYLVAKSLSDPNRPLRYFVADKIQSAELTGEFFERDQEFDIDQHAQKAFGAFQNEQEFGELVWKFRPSAAAHARDFLFHPAQVLEDQSDGSLVVRFSASGHLEMCWHLYMWGDQVEVLAPLTLRKMIEHHQRTDFHALP